MSVFNQCLEKITKEQIEEIKPYFKGYDYKGASCTFLSNYAWRDHYGLCCEVIGKYLCAAGLRKGDEDAKPVMLMPMTKDGTYDIGELRKTVLEVKRRFAEEGQKTCIVSLGVHMKTLLEQAFPGEMIFHHDEDSDEYVYLKDKLISLSGRALHKKKNHMNYFLKNFTYTVKDITPDMADEVMAFVSSHKMEKDADGEMLDSLHMEEDAIRRYLEHIDEEDIYSTAIYIDNKLEAIALGERLNQNTAAEHFEKANDDYRGLYQIICSEFCKRLPEEIIYVNREEDMGLENLRKAKEALRPDHKELKYWGCFL